MQQRSEETRAKILAASARLFTEQGYSATSVDELCEAAGVSKGAFYHHFESKQALFLELINRWLQTVDDALTRARDKPAPELFMQITGVFPHIFETSAAQLPLYLEFWLQASRDEKIWQASVAPVRRYHQYFAALIQQGVDEGSLIQVDPPIAARLIISMAMGLLLQSLLDPHGAPWEMVASESVALLVNTLLRKPA